MVLVAAHGGGADDAGACALLHEFQHRAQRGRLDRGVWVEKQRVGALHTREADVGGATKTVVGRLEHYVRPAGIAREHLTRDVRARVVDHDEIEEIGVVAAACRRERGADRACRLISDDDRGHGLGHGTVLRAVRRRSAGNSTDARFCSSMSSKR